MLDFRTRYDFTDYHLGWNTYQGANGAKISIIIDGEEYMLKFPANARQNPALHYSNSIVSEFIGSRIFSILGISAQETFIGEYKHRNGRIYEVVACRDFTELGKYSFHDFGSLKNTVISSPSNGYGTDLYSVADAIEEQLYVDAGRLSDFFWNMTVVDSFIANFDRHNGNWGFLSSNATGEWETAPVFDCGSSLYPQSDSLIRKRIMEDQNELEARLYQRPLSVFKINDRKIAYHDLLQSGLFSDSDKAVITMGERINGRIGEIHSLIEEAPIREEDKVFIRFMLDRRKEAIIDASIEKVQSIPAEERKDAFIRKYGSSLNAAD